MPRYNQVIMDKANGQSREVAEPDNPHSQNFRIVSHYGNKDWSPYLWLDEAKERFEQLPERLDGYFLLVEG